MRKKIIVKIRKSEAERYNYDYVFVGKHIYIENRPERYMRILYYLQKKGVLECL